MSDYYAWDIATGEGLTEDDLLSRYDDMLDEVTGEIHIGNLTYLASRVLKEVDPIAYRVGFNDWHSSELGETITEDEPEDDDEDEEV